MRDIPNYLANQADVAKDKDFKDMWCEVQQLYKKRLWHQLTQVLLKLVSHPEIQDGDKLFELYTNVIAEFETKINPLSLVQMCAPIVDHFKDKEEAVQFLEKIGEKVKASVEAYVLTRVKLGQLQLSHYENKEKAKELLEEIDGLLADVEGVGMVHGQFYMFASDLYMREGNHAEYYRASLRYLGCTDPQTLSEDERVSKAYHLSLAALLGKDIFNFGELLAHPILEDLKGTPKSWIVDLLTYFNAGDVKQFNCMRDQWVQVPDLVANESVLYEKICLLALMETTFRRGSTDRQLTFGDIASKTGLQENQVELLVMKALAKELVKGSIDQVAGTVNLTWVQPRVLDRDQVKTLVDKLRHLSTAISSMESMIENNASEILTV